jgi:FkbH-like protein
VDLIDALERLKQPVAENAPQLRVFLACGFTPLHLGTFLAAHLRNLCPGSRVEVNSGLYGDLAGSLERLRPEEHDQLVVVIEWPDLDPRLGVRALGGWQVEKLTDIVNSASHTLGRLTRALQGISLPTSVCLPTLPFPPLFHTAMRQSSMFELSLRRDLASFAETISRGRQVSLLSEQHLSEKSPLGKRFDLRTEIAQGFPYNTAHASVVGEILAELISRTPPKKGLITDLDNTLWAGILGEVGVEGVHWHLEQGAQLHGIYQQLLASLASAGILIGVASKNDAALVEKVFGRSDLLLPCATVFPIEAHWNRKSESVKDILTTWNVLPQSVVFVDDSPMEVAEVQQSFPDMECLLFPQNDYRAFWGMLNHLRNTFGKAAVSEEDSLRLQSIRNSGALRQSAGEDSLDDFLQQARGQLTFAVDDPDEETRAFELINKTNQFNLNGRRYDEAAWSKLLKDFQTRLVTVSYKDKFGRLGRIAALIGRPSANQFEVQTWVMSCRAFSRRIEFHCLQYIFDRFAIDEIVFEVQATGRNGPLVEFLQQLVDAPVEASARLSRSSFVTKAPKMPHYVEEVPANA